MFVLNFVISEVYNLGEVSHLLQKMVLIKVAACYFDRPWPRFSASRTSSAVKSWRAAAISTSVGLICRLHCERKLKARRTLRQDFALDLSAKRRLCNTVGGRFIEGVARCCAVSTAHSRAAATTNLARSNQSLVLRILFGGTKSSALVNIFMIRLVTRPADDNQT